MSSVASSSTSSRQARPRRPAAATASVIPPSAPSMGTPTYKTIVPGPDDSDFLDSDDDNDALGESGEEVESACGPAPQLSTPGNTQASVATSASSWSSASAASKSNNTRLPLHPLIAVSQGFSFTYFAAPAPSSSSLNARNGRAAALQVSPAAASQQDQRSAKSAGGQAQSPAQRYHWFCIDDDLVYLSFYEDWGPLNIAMFYRFCLHLHTLKADDPDAHLVLYTTDAPHQKANAALLVSLYAMVMDHITPADAFHPFSQLEFQPFRDAGYGRADFNLSIQDILYGVHKAMQCGLLDLSIFNLDEYEYYEQVAHGDWNWLTPNFIAFASPNDREYVAALRAGETQPSNLRRPLSSVFTHTLKYFKERDVRAVVRLNNPLYDRDEFTRIGIRHVDLYFDDGSNPSTEILRSFIQLADEIISAGGAVAVHCKAGLGRTGVLIGAYLIWKHGFSASEVIGFMRIMRPGCVVGPQQHFMYENFVEWIRWGVQDSAMREARVMLERERAGDSQLLLAKSSKVNTRKRAAEEELEEEDRLAFSHAPADTPVTPRAKRTVQQEAALQAAAVPPSVKPAPCVGQPRKSPSPSRKRPANTRNTGSTEASRVPSGSRVPSTSSSRGLGYMPRSISDESVNAARTAGTIKAPSTPGPSARLAAVAAPGTPGRVLGEAQRLNVQGGISSSLVDVSVTPRGVPAASSVALTDSRKLVSATGASRVSGHQRSRSAVAPSVVVPGEEDVFGQVLASPGCPPSAISTPRAGVTRTPTFRASPLVKDKYGLRDTTGSAQTACSPNLSAHGSVGSSAAGMGAPVSASSTRSAASAAGRSTSGTRSTGSKATPSVSGARPVSSAKERLARFYASAAANGGGPAPTPSSLSSRRARGITADGASSTQAAARHATSTSGVSAARAASSSSSRIGRVVRSRRSSMGEADVQA